MTENEGLIVIGREVPQGRSNYWIIHRGLRETSKGFPEATSYIAGLLLEAQIPYDVKPVQLSGNNDSFLDYFEKLALERITRLHNRRFSRGAPDE
jgi:hypothetical protein